MENKVSYAKLIEVMTSPRDHRLSVTDPGDKETYDLPNKEFELAVLGDFL